MTFDSADIAVIAELEAKATAFRAELKRLQPAIERLAEAEEATFDGRDNPEAPHSNIRDDMAQCEENLDNLLESIEELTAKASLA